MSLASRGFGSSALDPLAKISGSVPALNSVQCTQIYLYPKIVGNYQARVNVLISFFIQKLHKETFWCNQSRGLREANCVQAQSLPQGAPHKK